MNRSRQPERSKQVIRRRTEHQGEGAEDPSAARSHLEGTVTYPRGCQQSAAPECNKAGRNKLQPQSHPDLHVPFV